ncbi:hypothetical protein C2G38_2036619 [Gigaspora rosea]|uniref:Uncharacterized protein n=1 Tax=Gigaspora rosea TaxID=44941 RepID=A0A397VBS7_9GLOM|nr:hypothetical protein C2G38_2036619 [Gigaspora rosea]
MGVIYVDIPPDYEDLGEAFGKAINFTFEKSISFTEQLGRKILGITKDKPEISEWKRALRAFKRASATYKANLRAWSRAKPVMEIGDLSEKESMEYLISKRKINEAEAKKIYELVGGRIVELDNCG